MYRTLLIAWLLALSLPAGASEEVGHTTVIGPRNPDLAAGADQLKAGNADAGIRLTRSGLAMAQGRREVNAAYSNLCAGFLMKRDFESAFDYCNHALTLDERNWHAYSNRALAHFFTKNYAAAAADVQAGLAVNPHSSNLKKVKQMIDDVVNPVDPSVVIEYEGANDDDR